MPESGTDCVRELPTRKGRGTDFYYEGQAVREKSERLGEANNRKHTTTLGGSS